MDARHRTLSDAEQPPAPATPEPQTQRAALWGVLALLALLILLTSLMSHQPDASWGGPGARLMLRLPDPLVHTLMVLLALGAVAILVVLFPRELRFRRRKQPDEFQREEEPPKFSLGLLAVLLFALLLSIGLVVWLYWSGWEPFGAEREVLREAPAIPIESLRPEASAEKPTAQAPGFTWTLFVLAALVGLAIVAGAVWILLGDRIERGWYGMAPAEEARQALLEAVQISLDDLMREPDPRRAVIACYRRLEDVLGQHGLPRAPWQTPLEYLYAALDRFHLPARRLQGLTTLFELAKFSAHLLGEPEKRLAIAALREVRTTLAEEGSHVPTA